MLGNDARIRLHARHLRHQGSKATTRATLLIRRDRRMLTLRRIKGVGESPLDDIPLDLLPSANNDKAESALKQMRADPVRRVRRPCRGSAGSPITNIRDHPGLNPLAGTFGLKEQQRAHSASRYLGPG